MTTLNNIQRMFFASCACLLMPIFLMSQTSRHLIKPVSPSKPSIRSSPFIAATKDKKSAGNIDRDKIIIEEKLPRDPLIRVGTRFTYFFLLDKRGNLNENKFCQDMSINYLNAVQQYLPVKIYAQWSLMENFGIEATWDKIEAEARTHGDGENYSDGNMLLSGPMISFFREFPVETKNWLSKVSLGIGFAYLFGDFEEAYWWKYRVGAIQTMEIDDEFAFLATAGWTWNLKGRWDIDIYLRYLRANAVDTFTIRYEDPDKNTQVRIGTFPLDNVAFGIGISTFL